MVEEPTGVPERLVAVAELRDGVRADLCQMSLDVLQAAFGEGYTRYRERTWF